VAAIVQELFRFGLYKKSQGRIARQATFWALALIVALGAWSLTKYLGGYISDVGANNPDWPIWKQNLVHFGVPLVILAIGMWASFRAVQMPAFADFLISVEGEMNKVSWPSRTELFRASLVVMLVIFFLAGLLFAYDYILTLVLKGLDTFVSWMFG
jgi:preprotein translocase subunit SecE